MTTATTIRPNVPAPTRPRAPAQRRSLLSGWLPTAALLMGAVYCLLPVLWVLFAATKSRAELFTTFTLTPSFTGGFGQNLSGLLDFNDGVFLKWAENSAIYAGGGALLSVGVSALAGYGLAKFSFRGRQAMFGMLLAAVLVPGITLAIPQYLLMAKTPLSGTYWSVLLPSIVSPYGIYLARIYAAAAVNDETLEAARLDGASEWRIFRSVAAPIMFPGLVTVFLVQFVGIWNNFLLPYIMLSDDRKFPLTVGLYDMLNQGVNRPALYSFVIMGALLSIIPLMMLFVFLQKFWRMDLLSGGVKG